VNHPGTPGGGQRGHRRILAAGCAAVIAAALIAVIIVDGHSDDPTSQVAAPEPSAANFSPADTGAYIPSDLSAADLTHSPTTATAAAMTATAAPATGNRGVITNPAEVGAPTNIAHIPQVNGRFPYTLATINKTSPEQVAWAYTTLRYTVTWTDADSQQATTRAAAYTAPTLPPPNRDDTTHRVAGRRRRAVATSRESSRTVNCSNHCPDRSTRCRHRRRIHPRHRLLGHHNKSRRPPHNHRARNGHPDPDRPSRRDMARHGHRCRPTQLTVAAIR